ncbi:ribosomal protein L22 [Decorospora gaudefroyi]|uniref:Ribosomal protein L22 n=1 Tax=Decorospora gaudefroyi TaxID=184978 RepID=A0A6A5KJ25_9PLEO|nr:ribosomal protein L22 [Decorospora gaudefroyi]
MSARVPSGRLAHSALAAVCPRSARTRWAPSTWTPSLAHRHISLWPKKKKPTPIDTSNPIVEDYLRRQAEQARKEEEPQAKPQKPSRLSKSPSSLFPATSEFPGWREGLTPEETSLLRAQDATQLAQSKAEMDKELMSMNLDPNPEARRDLERRLVIAGVERHGRMTKAQKLARTERESLYKSQFLPTSIKKLQKVINQIAGKTVSEALVQLRFSKKKVARDVMTGLQIAQNEAIAARGMGLAGEELALSRWKKQRNATDGGKLKDLWDYKTSAADRGGRIDMPKVPSSRNTMIELKDGTKKVVRDPSEIYIDQAWVGPGESWKTPEYRARGKVNLLKHQTTSFSVLLKEETTRMRISDEIKKKRDNRKLWVALPDRPVTSQRQYCLW